MTRCTATCLGRRGLAGVGSIALFAGAAMLGLVPGGVLAVVASFDDTAAPTKQVEATPTHATTSRCVSQETAMGDDPDRATPEATLLAFQGAMMSGDWQRVLSLLSARAREGLVGSAYAGAAWMEGLDEASQRGLATLMDRYGLREEGVRRTRSIDELAQMLADLDTWSSALPDDTRLDLAADTAETTWSEYRHSGDRAYAIATLRGRRSETRLQCVDGQWYILASGE